MPKPLTARPAVVFVGALTLVVTGCVASAGSATPGAPPPSHGSPVRAAARTLTPVTVAVPSALRGAPLNVKRTLKIPTGWTIQAWARPAKARLLVWTPDGRLLVSQPASGKITRLTPDKRGYPTSATLISGLRQPH